MDSGPVNPKMRLLHPRLASAVAGLRHGEMICVSDAGAGSGPKSIVPLAADVERIDLGIATGVPSTLDVIDALHQVGDFEAAIVGDVTPAANDSLWRHLQDLYGSDSVHVVGYFPDWYEIRNRVKVFVQTGDYGLAASAILVAGYPSPNIPLDWLRSDEWYQDLLRDGHNLARDGKTWARD